MKKILVMLIAIFVFATVVGGCGNKNAVDENNSGNDKKTENASDKNESDKTSDEDVVIRIGGLSGPTSMGLVKLMEDSANGKTENKYEFADLATDPSTFVAPLAKGEIDVAAVPSNLASVIYNNTQGKVQVLAVNTLCVLNVVERGESINSVADLKGKKIYATGAGATPEYTLRYILEKNDINPDEDIEIMWCADTTEALSYVTNDKNAIAMLPQPFATVAMTKVPELRVALKLNDEWNKVESGCEQVTGVLVVRTEFAKNYPNQVDKFLSEYSASVNYLLENNEEGAALVEKYGIVPAAVAKKAIPECNIVCKTGKEMKEALSGFLQILHTYNENSVGKNMPGEDFYYGA